MDNYGKDYGALRARAIAAAGNAYAPYSHFAVGAAVQDSSGAVYAGCNVENASFGLTQCAERAALTAAVAAGAAPGSLTMLVIYTPGQNIQAPCGACRQVMQELMAPDSRVIACCDGTDTCSWTPQEYLPDWHDPDLEGAGPGRE